MLDPANVRDHFEEVRSRLRTRGIDIDKTLEDVATYETARRRLIPELEGLKRQQNTSGDEIARAKRQGKDTTSIQEASKLRSAQIKQLIDVFQRLDGPILAVERVPREDISSYGVIAIEPNVGLGDGIYQVRDLVEKPPREEAPSDLAIIGRYVLTPDIFPALAATKSDRTGEIQLTDGLRELLKQRPIYACEVKGVRHDTGNKLGFLKAVVYFALRRPDLAAKFADYLSSVNLQEFAGKR